LFIFDTIADLASRVVPIAPPQRCPALGWRWAWGRTGLEEAVVESIGWILLGGVAMTAIAGVGSVTLLLPEATLDRILVPLVAFAAGSLLGGAFFHMLPAAVEATQPAIVVFGWAMLGFVVFFVLEQFLHWHHFQRDGDECRQPLTILILLGDGLHNLLGGLGVAGVFLIDADLGLAAWLAAAAHEIPQELGDFGVLVHGGWDRRRALLLNLASGSTFLLGGLIAYAASSRIDVDFLVPFAAGNFIYIGASDLVPEIHRHGERGAAVVHLAAFAAGLALLWLIRLALAP
jgi:zinc and cadmium transporter